MPARFCLFFLLLLVVVVQYSAAGICQKLRCSRRGLVCQISGGGRRGSASCVRPKRKKAAPKPCSSNPCANGGTCIVQGRGFRCRCVGGFSGVKCKTELEREPKPCSSNPCANGGTCIERGQGFKCKCAEGFSGAICKTVKDKCSLRPCKNKGICENGPYGSGYTCTCLLGYEGADCGRKCRQKKLDILLIEDVSSSISQDEYRQIKDFEMEMLSYASIERRLINMALMVYSGRAEVNFYLNSLPTKAAVIAAVNAQNQTGGSTFLGDAINMAVSEVFVAKNGDRPDADNIVILFTDGKSSKTSTITRNIGRLLTEAVVFVVPTSSDLDLKEISEVASSPDEEHVFSLSNPLALGEIKARTIYMKCGVNFALTQD